MIEKYLQRKHVVKYKPDIISDDKIKSLLQKTWQLTSSKNNYMPYSVHVLGPDKTTEKEKIFEKCIDRQNENEKNANSNRKDLGWIYNHIKQNSHLLIFTARVCKPNPYNERQIRQGHFVSETSEAIVNSLTGTCAPIEVGMFAQNLTNFCMLEDIDVSFCVCFSKRTQDWQEFAYIKNTLIMMMSLGYGEQYYWDKLKRQGVRHEDNLKPEIDEVVKWA